MKILYGLDPDICMSNPEILCAYSKDIILPQYFYTQLDYLKKGSFSSATNTATKILNYLLKYNELDLLIFKTSNNGTIYFINQEINVDTVDAMRSNIDRENPLDRYLISLLKLGELMSAKIVFLALGEQVISKCNALGFEVASREKFLSFGESWLEPKMLLKIQAKLDPIALVEWQDYKVVQPEKLINWQDYIR